MPWKVTDPVDQRTEFINAVLARNRPPIADLAELFGISEKTAYKWLARFRAGGLPALEDRSRRPDESPNATSEEVRQALLELRKDHPKWGPKKLIKLMRTSHKELTPPAASTVGSILKAEGLVQPRRRRRAGIGESKLPFKPAESPNETWAIDHKGEFTVERRPCYPLTLSDSFSRFLFTCHACRSTAFEQARPILEQAFLKYGLPLRMRSDNGPPFGSQGIGGLSQLSVYLAHLGIEQEFITPGKPQENGRHERIHRTLKAEAVLPAGSSWPAQQLQFDEFRRTYNHVRPHEALQMRTPADVYVRSPRQLPGRLPEFAYHSGFLIRSVRTSGEIKWRGRTVFLSETLIGEQVGLLESEVDGWWSVHLGNWDLGLLAADGTLRKRRRARWTPGTVP